MTHDVQALGPGALLLAEVTSGSIGGHLASVLGTIPPWLGGAARVVVAMLLDGDLMVTT